MEEKQLYGLSTEDRVLYKAKEETEEFCQLQTKWKTFYDKIKSQSSFDKLEFTHKKVIPYFYNWTILESPNSHQGKAFLLSPGFAFKASYSQLSTHFLQRI